MQNEKLILELFQYRNRDDINKSEHHRLVKRLRKANRRDEGKNSAGWRRAISRWLFAQFRKRDSQQQSSDATRPEQEQWIDAKA